MANTTITVPTNSGDPVAMVPLADYDGDNLEGPVWIDGWLYLSEIQKRVSADLPQGGRILRYQTGKGAEVFLADAGTNGLAVSPTGDLLAASQKLGAIVSFEISGASSSATPKKTYAATYDGKRFSSPNDLAMRSDGNIYFTDPAYQSGSVKQSAERAYRVDPAGSVSEIPGAPQQPNGIRLSLDETALYIGGASLMKYPVMADGSLGAGSVFPEPSSGISLTGTDGMGLDCAGNLYVAVYSQGIVEVITPAGARAGTIQVGSGVTNIAFGGADGKTLFITRMTPPSLYSVASAVPGLPY